MSTKLQPDSTDLLHAD